MRRASWRLCGCNDLEILIPKLGPTVNSVGVKSKFGTKFSDASLGDGPRCQSLWSGLGHCGRLNSIAMHHFWMFVFPVVCMVCARKVTRRNSPKNLILKPTKTTVSGFDYRSHPSNTFNCDNLSHIPIWTISANYQFMAYVAIKIACPILWLAITRPS